MSFNSRRRCNVRYVPPAPGICAADVPADVVDDERLGDLAQHRAASRLFIALAVCVHGGVAGSVYGGDGVRAAGAWGEPAAGGAVAAEVKISGDFEGTSVLGPA